MQENIREELPPFKGQYSDEKVLFYVKENIVNFIFKKIYILISLLIFSSIFSGIIYYFYWKIFFIVSIFLLIFFIIYYYYLIYRDTLLTFTTRRMIKDVRTGLFSKHKKELKILDVKSSMTNKSGFLHTILWIWNIKVEWAETKAAIYFTWIKEHKQISNYIWRVIDYIKLNAHTDNIARYQDKKYRQKNK